ncbi:MAG: AAA family ATPase, partial [Acidimicrobiia bacterium]|nr:AAA family ATPase [Acidimicrobiia bacterium]
MVTAPAEADRPTAAVPPPGDDGHLRRLTIVFCDLVGSTELSARLDPEDLRDTIRRYQSVCHEVIDQAGGRICNYLGDGILAYFGAPVPLEDAGRRAVDAALAMVAATGRLTTGDGYPLAARASLHTGPVVLSSMGSGDAGLDLDVIGEAVNLAARLESHAEAGSIVISEVTARLVAGFFDIEEIGPLSLKGVAEPMSAYRVTGQTGIVSRLDARAVCGLSPFVGRRAELEALVEHCADPGADTGKAVLVTGESGVGKSRLVRELLHAPALQTAATLFLQAQPELSATPFAPLRHSIAAGAGDIDALHPPAAITDLLAAEGTGRRLFETAERRRARIVTEVVDWLREEAARRPVVVVADDLQWFDASTMELVDELVSSGLAAVGPSVVATARPGTEPSWPKPSMFRVDLQPLDDTAATDLVGAVSPAARTEVAEILARAEGIPLYLEEIAAAVDRTEPGDHALPATIAELLSARLDVGGEGTLVRNCSVIGRRLPLDLLAEVFGIESDALDTRLGRLVSSGVLRVDGDGTYAFRHLLLQEAAYDSLLRSDRRRLHTAVADALDPRSEGGAVSDAAGPPETLARHLEAAELYDRAWRAWRDAADHATARGASIEALQAYDAGLRTLARTTTDDSRLRREVRLTLAAAHASFRVNGAGSVDTVER